MLFRVLSSLRVIGLLLAFALTLPQVAPGQLRISATPAPKSTAHPQDQITSSLALNLCVDGSATYPCPNPITSDGTYIPAITLTYGQILDGVVVYGPPALNTGTITIYKDTDAVCTLVIGVDHSCPPNSTIFDVGNYTLTASLTFPPGSQYPEADAAPVAISIAQDPTSIALSSTPNPAPLGTPVTFTAVVSGTFPATPTGQVVFTLDGNQLPPATLDPTGTATFTTSTLALGSHTMTASYSGALDFVSATDVQETQVIVPPATITTIASSLNPSTVGASVTFTSTVSVAIAGLGVTPTGSVTFKDGTASFATVPLKPSGAQNIAQTAISTLNSGTHNITAIYSGDATTAASVSKVFVQQVDYPLTEAQPGYTITVTPSPVSLIAGATANLTVTVAPLSGFTGAVTLSCGNLPSESACTFGDATIPIGGGSTTLALTTMSPHDCGSDVPYGGFGSLHPPISIFGGTLRYGSPTLAGVLLLLLPCRRRSIRLPLLLIVVCALASLTGCGNRCTDFGTAPGHYTFKINGTTPAATPVTAGGLPGSGTESPNVSTSVALTIKL